MKTMGIGVDIEEVARFRKFDICKGKKFYERLFTKSEIKYCLSKADPYTHFAARFAAKEAAIKACAPYIRLFFSDIEVKNNKDGSPFLTVISKKKKELKNKMKNFSFFVSLSHTENNAVAFVHLVQTRKITCHCEGVKRPKQSGFLCMRLLRYARNDT